MGNCCKNNNDEAVTEISVSYPGCRSRVLLQEVMQKDGRTEGEQIAQEPEIEEKPKKEERGTFKGCTSPDFEALTTTFDTEHTFETPQRDSNVAKIPEDEVIENDDDGDSFDLSDEESRGMTSQQVEMATKRIAIRLMRSSSQELMLGDSIDKSIGLTLSLLCSYTHVGR